MPVGLTEPETLLPVPGIDLAAGSAGLYQKQRSDLALLAMEAGTICSAVFTNNQFCAAPVQVARMHLQQSAPRYLIINAGNANAGTGQRGVADARQVCEAVAHIGNCDPSAVLPFSTGVIGEYLPVAKIQEKLPELFVTLAADNWLPVVRAIMTTDTVAKAVSKQMEIDNHTITITGITKGSGMIRPDMATMLAFVATDGKVEQKILDNILRNAVEKSFNRISVDGDTSTNDACVLLATGKSRCNLSNKPRNLALFEKAVTELCVDLAQAIIRDGEGATKFITVAVHEGHNQRECLQVAYAIAHSPLVKTACFASDPNWGRILAAIGRAGLPDLDIDRIRIYLDDTCIVERGMRAASYTENAGQTVMRREEFTLQVYLGRGSAVDTIWTCDLSHEYVKINAEYRS